MLKNKNSWAIKWYASNYINNNLTLYFKSSLVKNIGFDKKATNTRLDYDLNINKFEKFNFNEFVDYDIKNNLKVLRQYDFCTDNQNNFCLDKAIKFENLNDDFNEICLKIFQKNNMLKHYNQSKHKDYQEYYDQNTKNKIYNCCKKDIDFFEYEF